MWKFDAQTAKIYAEHVRVHIPDYDHVINLTVDICRELCDKDAGIVDFGCATGYTIQRLSEVGFTNLIGVDVSQDMIDYCNKISGAKFYTILPKKKYKTIIANWSLHFNENKSEILQNFYELLEDDGFLILSEKTIQSSFIKKKYYDLKQKKGASVEEIKNKEENLKGVMHINDVEWYYQNLKQFKTVDVISASTGFVTLIAFKT